MKITNYLLIAISILFFSCNNDDETPGVFLLQESTKQTNKFQDPVTSAYTFTNEVTIDFNRQNNYSGDFSIKVRYVSGDDEAKITNLDGSAIDPDQFITVVNDQFKFSVEFNGTPTSSPQYVFFGVRVDDREEVWLQDVSFNQRLSKRID